MSTTRYRSDDDDLDGFYREIAEHDLQPLWEMRGLLTATPTVKTDRKSVV